MAKKKVARKKAPAKRAAKKKAAKKSPPKKRQRPLKGMEDEFKLPRKLQKAAEEFQESKTEASRAATRKKEKHAHLLLVMASLKRKQFRCLLPNGDVFVFRRDSKDEVKTEKPKKKKDEKK